MDAFKPTKQPAARLNNDWFLLIDPINRTQSLGEQVSSSNTISDEWEGQLDFGPRNLVLDF